MSKLHGPCSSFVVLSFGMLRCYLCQVAFGPRINWLEDSMTIRPYLVLFPHLKFRTSLFCATNLIDAIIHLMRLLYVGKCFFQIYIYIYVGNWI